MHRMTRSADKSAVELRVTRSSAKSTVHSKENSAITATEKTPKTQRSPKRTYSSSADSSSPKSSRSNSMSPINLTFADKLIISTPKGNNLRSARCALALAGNNDNLRLPGRENEYDELTTYLKDLIQTNCSGSLYISGAPGTGKTATLSKLISTEELRSKLRIVSINCTSVTSVGGIYMKICKDLNLKPETERVKHCKAAIEYELKRNHKTTLLVLDEIDQLCSLDKKEDVLHQIFEWPSIPNSKLILIGIANALDLTDRLLDRLQSKCELKPRVMHFAAYTKTQLVDIFKSRLEESGVSDLFPPAAIQLIAAKVAAVSGDVRRALNIGKQAVEMAKLEQKRNAKTIDILQVETLIEGADLHVNDKKIELKNVASVLNKVYGNSQKHGEDVDGFPILQKILICTLLLIIKHDKKKAITIGRLHDVYKKVCRQRNIDSVDLSEFLNLCILTETRGIIKIVKKKEIAKFQQIELRWDEDEVSTALKDKQMMTNILNEKHLLSQ